jgi:hypothetical protein
MFNQPFSKIKEFDIWHSAPVFMNHHLPAQKYLTVVDKGCGRAEREEFKPFPRGMQAGE